MPNLYLAAKPQNWPIPHFLDDLCTAESMVATMGWEEIVAQPSAPFEPAVKYVDHRAARFYFTADAGVVTAVQFAINAIN